MATFRNLKIIKFDNIAVKGEYEYKEKPWIIIFLVGFKMGPTDHAETYFSNEGEMQSYIANRKLGKNGLSLEAEKVLPTGWLWAGLRYSYDHNPRQFTFGKTTSFQVEFNAEVPEEVEKMGEQGAKKFVETEFKKIAEKFSRIPNFQSDDLFTFKPATSIK